MCLSTLCWGLFLNQYQIMLNNFPSKENSLHVLNGPVRLQPATYQSQVSHRNHSPLMIIWIFGVYLYAQIFIFWLDWDVKLSFVSFLGSQECQGVCDSFLWEPGSIQNIWYSLQVRIPTEVRSVVKILSNW